MSLGTILPRPHRIFSWAAGMALLPWINILSNSDLTGAPAPTPSPETTITYLLQDFPSAAWLESWYLPIPWGKAQEETDHFRIPGQRAVRLTWNDKAWKTSWVKAYGEQPKPENEPRWMAYVIDRRTLGLLNRIQTWIYTPQESLNLPVSFLLADAQGAEFHSSTASLAAPGWNLIPFSVPASSSRTPPITIKKLLLAGKNTSGYISLDQIAVEVTAPPRDLIEAVLKPGETDFIAGPDLPVFSLNLKNHSPMDCPNIQLDLQVTQLDSGAVLLKQHHNLNLPAGGIHPITFKPDFPFGRPIQITWKTNDSQGQLTQACGQAQPLRLFRDLSLTASGPAQRTYLTQWGSVGGIAWSSPYQRLTETGSTWIRIVDPRWATCEINPGQYDFSPIREILQSLDRHSLNAVYAGILYTHPSFYDESQRIFAPAYGRFHRALARQLGPRLHRFELGNETNGPEKYLYTEVARHGAAGIRSAHPHALIGNAGTAGVDLGFLRLQADRDLFDYLDDLVIHPYTFGASPEEAKLYEKFGQIDQLIDELGGMKSLYTTEWGWPHSQEVPEKGWFVDQDTRACYIVRQFAIDAAAGIGKDGLFAWDDHFGIYHKRRPFPAAAAVNAYCSLTRAHQFAGWLEKTDHVHALVFERAGTPLLMAWSPGGSGTFTLKTALDSVSIRDMYGNRLPPPAAPDSLVLTLDVRPLYIEGLPPTVLLAAWHNTRRQARQRYQDLLSQSPLKDDPFWQALAAKENPDFSTIKKTLLSWQPASSKITTAEQAVIAQTLRLAILTARMAAPQKDLPPEPPGNEPPARQNWPSLLAQLHDDQDIDIPSLRWLLTSWQKIQDEALMHAEARQNQYARSLTALDEVFHKLCGVFLDKGRKIFFPIWPYLHASSANDPEVTERLTFTPGCPSPVQMRLYSYAAKSYPARVHLELPPDWRCEPPFWQGVINPDQQVDTVFQVTAGLDKTRTIRAVLSVPDKPDVSIPYDNLEILLPISIEPMVLDTLLPAGPLRLTVTNRGAEPVSGKLRILPGVDLPPWAYTYVNDVPPGQSRPVELRLNNDLPVPPFNEWKLLADFFVQGRETMAPFIPDFSCAARVTRKPAIDADLREWITAPVLHMDQESCTDGSFGSDWSKTDLSARIYTLWDDQAFYLAAQVEDQWFQQGAVGGEVFAQDSIQLAFSDDDRTMREFSLALTPQGPQVWYYGDPAQPDGDKKVHLAELAVKIAPGSGNTVYECAIPWSEIFSRPPSPDQTIRFDILLNDDDIVYPRRYMFRFGRGIVHTKNPKDLGFLRLSGQQPDLSVQDPPENTLAVFQEDFEEYHDGQIPDLWQSITHLPPPPESIVRAHAGRNHSHALVLNNSLGTKPAVYRNLIRKPKNWRSGQKYQLSAWVKGRGTTGIGIASDPAGVQGFHYIPLWQPSDQWQQITTEIHPSQGQYLIIRNETIINNLIIDDLEIVPK